MSKDKIIQRCMETLGMSAADAQWVADNLYSYVCPDWSEWSWRQIDESLRDVLFFKDKTDAEILAVLA